MSQPMLLYISHFCAHSNYKKSVEFQKRNIEISHPHMKKISEVLQF